jgi:hypothetical protein
VGAEVSQIDAVTMERSEKLIRVLFETGEWPKSATDHLNIDESGMSRFIAHQVQTMREMYKDIDPRHEAALATMLTHVYFCGVAAGRSLGYSEDEGLR